VVSTQADGWSVAGESTSHPPPKAGDLSNFCKTKPGPVVVGPSSVLAGKEDGMKCGDTLAGSNSVSSVFVMLCQDVETADKTAKPNQSSNGMMSTGLGACGAPESQLLPRQDPVEAENEVNDGPTDHPANEGGDDAPPGMSKSEANRKIAEAVKDFFAIRDVNESEDYFIDLPPEYHHRLVEELVSKAAASGETDGKLVAGAFARAAEKKLCSASDFEEGFLSVAEILDHIVADASEAIQNMATMMKGARLDKDEERRIRIAQKLMGGDKLLELLP